MKKVTVQEYASMLGVSDTVVYRKIKKGEIATKLETINNREVTVILLEDEQILQSEHCEPVGNIDGQVLETSVGNPIENTINTELLTGLICDNREMRKEIIGLSQRYMEIAQLAGQAKLLTDSENRTKQEYFQLVQENATLKATLEYKNQQLSKLQEEVKNKDLKTMSFKAWIQKL